MNSRHILIGLSAMAITISGATFADEIYKWTDAEGNVHYEDRPSGAASEERMKLSFRRTDNAAVQKRVQSRLDSQAARDEVRAAADADAKTAADKKAEAEERKKRCTDYRGKLEVMVQSRRLYREDENGERVYLDDDARQEARRRAEELVKENCD